MSWKMSMKINVESVWSNGAHHLSPLNSVWHIYMRDYLIKLFSSFFFRALQRSFAYCLKIKFACLIFTVQYRGDKMTHNEQNVAHNVKEVVLIRSLAPIKYVIQSTCVHTFENGFVLLRFQNVHETHTNKPTISTAVTWYCAKRKCWE